SFINTPIVSNGKNVCMKELRPIRLKQLKIGAKLLHKNLKSNIDNSVNKYLNHPFFNNLTALEIEKRLNDIRLKDAYYIISSEYGYNCWEDLKQQVVNNDLLYRSNGISLIHKWCKSYDEAHKYHTENGGYLLHFWADYVICGIEYVKLLELDQYYREWELIGYNWVEPTDKLAYQRLLQKAMLQYSLL